MSLLNSYWNNLVDTYSGKQSFGTGLKNAAGIVGQGIQSAGNWFNKTFDPTGSVAQQNEYEKNLALQQQAQAFNSAEAEKDRRWQEEMSNTAYSRAFKDLESAGYNPYLALTSGAAASTPGGASASSSAASVSRQNNKVLGTTAKAVEGLMKLGQNSASNLSSVARIVAMAMLAL